MYLSTGKNRKTVYGTVDRARLEELQSSFDKTRLLEAVDLIDEIRARLCDPQRLRLELLNLHAMAHTIINGADITVSRSEWHIWSKATDLEMEISDYAEKLGALADLIQELAMLAPDEDNEEEGADAAT